MAGTHRRAGLAGSGGLAGLLGLSLALAAPAAAQGSGQITGAQESGARNFEGVWKIARPTTVLQPVSGPVPFTAEGLRQYKANKALQAKRKYDDYDITLSRCSSPGTPRLSLTPMRFKIWQRQNVVTFDYEWNRAIRQINLGVPPKPDLMGTGLVPTATGKAKGHWDGDVLVAETTDLMDRTLLDDLVPHGFDLKVTEHYRLVDANTLENRITIEDPEFFTHAWDAVVTYKRQPDALFPEDVCLDRVKAGQPVFPK